MPPNYDHSQSQAFAKQNKLIWLPEPVAEFDQLASHLGMTQAQVDMCIHMHLRQILWLFSPNTYRWYQRILFALWFLFGWRKKSELVQPEGK